MDSSSFLRHLVENFNLYQVMLSLYGSQIKMPEQKWCSFLFRLPHPPKTKVNILNVIKCQVYEAGASILL